jgi:hypothetical protein
VVHHEELCVRRPWQRPLLLLRGNEAERVLRNEGPVQRQLRVAAADAERWDEIDRSISRLPSSSNDFKQTSACFFCVF